MSFATPERLWLLILLPVLGLLIFWTKRRRARDWSALGQTGRFFSDGGWCWLAVIGLIIVALAQPRWGRRAGSDLPAGHDVVLVLDVSRSMGAEDAVPNRLGAAVESAVSLVEALGREPGHRVAVVALAGRGVLRCPLTENLGAVVEILNTLQPGSVQPGGTNLGAGLDVALDAFDDQEVEDGRTIVIFSDGEDHVQTWPARLNRLREARVLLHTVALGDPEQGHPVPTGRPGTEAERFVHYQGQLVLSQRDDRPLRTLALATGGTFIPLGLSALDLGTLYEVRIAPFARQRRSAMRPPEPMEQFRLFVALALLIGLIGSWPYRGPLRWDWRSWPRWRWRWRWPWRFRFRRRLRVWVVLAISMLGAGADTEPNSPEAAVASGNAAFAQGDLEGALKAFERARALASGHPIPHYNIGAVLFRLGRFDEALAHYQAARERADEALRLKIDYGIGNAAVALRDIGQAFDAYDACLDSTIEGPDFDAIRRDALINRRFAEQLASLGVELIEDEADAGQAAPDGESGPDGQPDPPDPDDPDPFGEGFPGPAGPTRPVGGAGGTGTRVPPPGTPEAQLADALEVIRDARARRLPDSPPGPPSEEIKDW